VTHGTIVALNKDQIGMLKSKTKGLYIDVSEFSILAAKTSGYKLPIVIEDLTEIMIKPGQDPEDIRAELEEFIDFNGNDYLVSRCGVYPDSRFVRFFEAESVNKIKDTKHLTEVLKTQMNIDPDKNNVSILDARDGSDFNFEKALTKKIIFCGASQEDFQKVQDQLLSYGVYPDEMALSTVTTLGGICDYARFTNLQNPLLCLEVTAESANIFIQSKGQLEVTRPVAFGLDSIYPLLQRELGLKDEASARKLFFSNTFDFAEMGPKLMRRMIKELQASTGFYEVQTGQTIDRIVISVLPKNLAWIGQTVSEALGLEVVKPDLESWLESLNIQLAENVDVSNLGARWMGLFSLMGEYNLREEVANG